MEGHTIILEYLQDIAKKNTVHIVFAVEVSSRLWGIDDAASDYDVKFVYLRPDSFYSTRLQETKDDVIQEKQPNVDLVGYDLRKFLRLSAKGNGSCWEWLRSDQVYLQDAYMAPLLRDRLSFAPASLLHYYASCVVSWFIVTAIGHGTLIGSKMHSRYSI